MKCRTEKVAQIEGEDDMAHSTPLKSLDMFV